MPVGPPKWGTVGLTRPFEAGSTRTSARSLYWQVFGSFSPIRRSVIHDEYASLPVPTVVPWPLRERPWTNSTVVPIGCDPVVHPFVSPDPPVPAQCAAYPTYTLP